MKSKVAFTYADKVCHCDVYIDTLPDPRYIFVMLSDPNLTQEFGKDVTIETDFIHCFLGVEDNENLTDLKQGIFDNSTLLPEFIAARKKIEAMSFDCNKHQGNA